MSRRSRRSGSTAATWSAAVLRRAAVGGFALLGAAAASGCGMSVGDDAPSEEQELSGGSDYPWHTDIVATTFWIGEILDPDAPDGSQMISTYDSKWYEHYGGCDGVIRGGVCGTERRTAWNGYFPTRMRPLENPFYLDLPYDDVHDPRGFAMRPEVIPWADEPEYRHILHDRRESLMKNRWVRLVHDGAECYGQIQDAGPGVYDDAAYVFGGDDRRPANRDFNGSGIDVSPALNGCLGFTALNGTDDRVDWQFVDSEEVPPGPWLTLVTTRGVG